MFIDLENVFNNHNFLYDKKRKCYRSRILNPKINFNVNFNRNDFYMFAVKYNSIKAPKLKLYINNELVNQSFLSQPTMTYDKILSHRYEEGPYKLKNGYNTFLIECEGVLPDIYSIEITPFIENINKYPNISAYRRSDFILIENYNNYGGFYWCLNNYMICCYACEKFRKIPIVNFNSGLFMNNSNIESPLVKENTNWFYNYFENPIGNLPYTIHNLVINSKKRITLDTNTLKLLEQNKPVSDDDTVIYFNRYSFVLFTKEFHTKKPYKAIIDKYIKFLPHIKNHIQEIKSKIFPIKSNLNKFIGIHYRGTDKIEEHGSHEQNPKHFKYNEISNLIYKKMKEYSKENVNYKVFLVISSDEEPFLNFMIKKFRNKIIYYKEASRSIINTSGMVHNFTNIPRRDISIDEKSLLGDQLISYKARERLLDNSLHIGNKNISNYKKGLDCLIDALILEDVDILYKSKGNFSMFCSLFNRNPNAEIYELYQVLNK